MASFRPAPLLSALAVVAALALSGPVAAIPEPELVAGWPVIDGVVDADVTIEPLSSARSEAPSMPAAGAAWATGAGIRATFEGQVPAGVQRAARHAVDHWDRALAFDPAAPVEVRFRWEALGDRVLGYGGPTWFAVRPELGEGHWPIALANTLLGTDLNSASPEIVIGLNSDLPWHLDPATEPPNDRADLFTTILHEIGHGLGFVSSVAVEGTTATALDLPLDRLLRTSATSSAPTFGRLGPSARTRAATSGLFAIATDGRAWAMHTPPEFRPASSVSHFAESYASGSAGSLMSPQQALGEAERGLDAPTLAVMAGLGWPIAAPLMAPSEVTTGVDGDRVTVGWTLDQREALLPGAWTEVRLLSDGGTSEVLVAASIDAVDLIARGAPRTVQLTTVHGSDRSTTVTVTVGPVAAGVADRPSIRFEAERAGDERRAVVRALYRAALDREPDPVGGDYWIARLDAGDDLRQVAAWFVTAPEYLAGPAGVDDDAFLRHLYSRVLRRTPDGAGWRFWANELDSGRARSDVMATFVHTAEVFDAPT